MCVYIYACVRACAIYIYYISNVCYDFIYPSLLRTNTNSLLGLDPHTTYPALSLANPFPSVEEFQRIHIEDLQETKFTQLDPSLTLGFYFRNKEEFDAFCYHYSTSPPGSMIPPSSYSSGHVQLFSIEYAAPDISCVDVENDSDEGTGLHNGFNDDDDDDDDDFVFI